MIVTPYIFWVTRASPLDVASCLSFHGISATGKYSFFGTQDQDCLRLIPSSGLQIPVQHESNSQLVWFERDLDAVDASLHSRYDDDFLEHLLALPPYLSSDNQLVLGEPVPELEIVYEGQDTVLVHTKGLSAQTFDPLPPLWKSMVIPQEATRFIPVPSPALERVRELLSSVNYNPVIDSLVNSISVGQMRKDIRYLTGEDPASPIISRHSFSSGILHAAAWLKDKFEATGASCDLKPFLSGFGPNVIW